MSSLYDYITRTASRASYSNEKAATYAIYLLLQPTNSDFSHGNGHLQSIALSALLECHEGAQKMTKDAQYRPGK
jgi:hypothetical protein